MAITSATGAVDLYWLLVAPGLIGVIARHGKLNLRWWDPAGTPGLRLFSDGMWLTAIMLLLGSVAISVLGFVLPQATQSPPLLWLLYALSTTFFITGMRVSIMPFIWIFRMITSAKREALGILTTRIEDGNRSPEVRLKDLELYGQIAAAPNMPFSIGAVVNYGACFCGSIAAFLVSLVIH